MTVTAGVPTDTYSRFGPLVGAGNVEAAVLDQLRSPASGLLFYLAEVERQNGMAARTLPAPEGPFRYRGGLDFETFKGEEFPLVVVVVQPLGVPERRQQGEYEQWFEVRVAATVVADDEQTVRPLAHAYGLATMGCLAQQGGLGGLAGKTLLYGSPSVEFVDPDTRKIARSVTAFRTLVQPTVIERYGPPPAPPGPPPDPYATPDGYPIAQDTGITITALPLH